MRDHYDDLTLASAFIEALRCALPFIRRCRLSKVINESQKLTGENFVVAPERLLGYGCRDEVTRRCVRHSCIFDRLVLRLNRYAGKNATTSPNISTLHSAAFQESTIIISLSIYLSVSDKDIRDIFDTWQFETASQHVSCPGCKIQSPPFLQSENFAIGSER